MKTDYSKSIELLNKAVNEELDAIHQYLYFHFHCDDQNFDLLAALFRRTAIAEMMHVEQLAERILFLGGEVEMTGGGKVEHIKDVEKMLEKSFQMEDTTVLHYNQWALECANAADAASKKLFENLVLEEEVHRDQYDNEINNLNTYGKSYLSQQVMERSKAIASGRAEE
ncbi:MAG: bacterioferritin [Bacteroidales bacterium]|nr:bacterioferritin [Bacteroidales bacterium]